MKYYAVIDTNVLVSAMLKWDSVPGTILQLTFGGVIVPVFNDAILAEYRTVLSRPKFHFTEDIINAVLDEITRLGIFAETEKLEEELPDPKDRVFYEVTLGERKEEDAFLVTGNIKHFPLVSFVVTPRQMLSIVYKNLTEVEQQ